MKSDSSDVDDGASRGLAAAEQRGGWIRFYPQLCDVCNGVAVWRHPAGGRRCRVCPRAGDLTQQPRKRQKVKP